MRFFVNGFIWEATQPKAGQSLSTKAEALRALSKAPAESRALPAAYAAYAAFSVADYGHAIACVRGVGP